MLNTDRYPDISDLGAMCRRTLDIAEMLDYSAYNMTDYSGLTDAQRIDFDRMQSAISYFVDAIREISAVASVLDNYEYPETYGFPAKPQESRSAELTPAQRQAVIDDIKDTLRQCSATKQAADRAADRADTQTEAAADPDPATMSRPQKISYLIDLMVKAGLVVLSDGPEQLDAAQQATAAEQDKEQQIQRIIGKLRQLGCVAYGPTKDGERP